MPHLLSTLFPVSLSITDDFTMVGFARLIMCSHSSMVRKLWYMNARGSQDKVSTHTCSAKPQACTAYFGIRRVHCAARLRAL